ncbi:MAG: hypothetical protein ABIG37_02655 [Nanoarchaeota archaeon]|nr:hypothetical protein [Nanoarchaeota archaeon]
MKIKIGHNYLDNLIEKRALILEAIGKENLEDFLSHVLKKGNMEVIVSCSDCGVCYECCGKINPSEGIEIKVFERIYSKQMKKFFDTYSTLYFHRYHFRV